MSTLIRPVDLNGMVQRAQDVTTIKHNEDNKAMQDQQNIQHTLHKNTERTSKQVVEKDDADDTKYNYDAKKKGNGQYSGQQKKKREKKEEDKVVIKSNSHFDIKI